MQQLKQAQDTLIDRQTRYREKLAVMEKTEEEIKEKEPDKSVVIVVDAKDGAIEFYKKYGFSQLKENDANQLYTILE